MDLVWMIKFFVTMVSEHDNELDVSNSNLGGTYSYYWGSPEFFKPLSVGFLRKGIC